jgi:hypothetical protein
MIQKTFKGGYEREEHNRFTIIKNEAYFDFYFFDKLDRHLQRLEYLRENEMPIEDEDLECSEDYSIPILAWEIDKTERLDRGDNWHFHMEEKRWFTKEMAQWMNENSTNKYI